MLEKLKAIEQRLTEVEQQLSDPAVYGDRERLTALSREQFLTMVEELAAHQGIDCPRDVLRAEAVKWEMRHPSRTPRTALQFLASLHAQ